MSGLSDEWLIEMAKREDGKCVSVGGLLARSGCYSAPDPRTRLQKFRDKLFPSKHCFAPEAPGEYQDCIHGQAITRLSFVDRLRVLFTGVVVTQWRTVTEHKVGKAVSAATCHIGTAKDLVMLLFVLLFSSTCFAQDRYQLDTRPGSYTRSGERYANPPRLYSGGRYLGEFSANRYNPDSISNKYGRYGSMYSPDSVNNAYGPYGRYSVGPIYVYPRRSP